jgi:carboxymethylenebutenolidase
MNSRKQAGDFPQEAWNLFDRYVHGEMDRRDFIDALQKFTVCGLSATALFELMRPNYAWAVQVAKDDKRIHTEQVTIASPKGNGKIRGTLAMPSDLKKTRSSG